MNYYIQKFTGKRERFDLKKFKRSLRKSGASDREIQTIITQIKKKRPKSTQEIHELTLRLLKKENRQVADRYNLKRGIMELGPEGYPFEKFIGELFMAQGYKVKTNLVIPGLCVTHEVDGLAEKNDKHYMIETKFHNRMGIKSDVKVALYVQARFEDICDYWIKDHKIHKYHQAWLVTNTKFTSQAIQYGECKKMKLIGWNYPAKNSLAQLVERYDLFPITTLTSLTKKQKREFINAGFVMCKHAKDQIKLLKKLGLSDRKIQQIIDESQAVCRI